MEKQKILVVDDDKHIAELISLYMMKEGYETREIYDGKEAAAAVEDFQPDLILLDLMLPGMDGYQVCTEVRKTSRVPIIMLTAKGETFDKVLGLELGADDYIVKPFEPKELVARVKAVLRRYEPKQEEDKNILKFGELEINLSNYSVLYHGKSLDFPPKEFELLSFLAQHPNRVFTREQLLDRIWGYEYVGDTRTVDVHVKRIREKLNSEDEWGIRTVWSVGYKFGQNKKGDTPFYMSDSFSAVSAGASAGTGAPSTVISSAETASAGVSSADCCVASYSAFFFSSSCRLASLRMFDQRSIKQRTSRKRMR